MHVLMLLSETISVSGILIRSYGIPNGTGRCPAAQCYDKTWATLAQSKITWASVVNAVLDVGS